MIDFSPDTKRVFLLLRQVGLGEEEAYTLVQEIEAMAGRAIIAEIRALQAEIRGQRAIIWTLVGILGAAVCGGLAALVLQATK